MIRILNANLKKFMGAKYERIPKTLVIWAVVFCSLRAAEIRLEIAPAVVWLTTLFLTAGGFVQVLSSDDTAESLRGQLMLPESPAKFHTAFFLSVAIYTLFTKSGLLLTAYLALGTANSPATAGFAVCFIAGGAAAYPLAFRPEKKTASKRCVGGAEHSFIVYLLRYLWNNKNYLINTAALWAFGCVFAVFMNDIDFPDIFPIGFALMCLNTPLGILLSSDRALCRRVSFLPGQVKGVLLPYAFFVAAVNAAACEVYLIAWYSVTGNITLIMIALAALFSVTSAALAVILEMRCPLLNWKTASDLWHHPRKYIVPGVMVLFAAVSIILLQ